MWFVLRRTLASAAVLLVASLVGFALVAAAGDPLAYLKEQSPPPAPSVLRGEMQRLRLDRPWLDRYWRWLDGLVHGDLGPPLQRGDRIGADLMHALGVSAFLVVPALVVTFTLAAALALLGASGPRGFADRGAMTVAMFFRSVPVFWLAIVLKEAGVFYNHHVTAHTFFTIGDRSAYLNDHSILSEVRDRAGHLVLPCIALVAVTFGAWARYLRGSMLDAAYAPWVTAAVGRGLTRRSALIRHALRAAVVPFTSVAALDLARMLGGTLLIEVVFQWHGLGYLFVSDVATVDTYPLLAWILLTAILVIVLNVFADVMQRMLDPRLRDA